MNRAAFTLHDVSAFPVVRMRNGDACAPGYAPAWCREMDALLGRNTPFVLIYEGAETTSRTTIGSPAGCG